MRSSVRRRLEALEQAAPPEPIQIAVVDEDGRVLAIYPPPRRPYDYFDAIGPLIAEVEDE